MRQLGPASLFLGWPSEQHRRPARLSFLGRGRGPVGRVQQQQRSPFFPLAADVRDPVAGVTIFFTESDSIPTRARSARRAPASRHRPINTTQPRPPHSFALEQVAAVTFRAPAQPQALNPPPLPFSAAALNSSQPSPLRRRKLAQILCLGLLNTSTPFSLFNFAYPALSPCADHRFPPSRAAFRPHATSVSIF